MFLRQHAGGLKPAAGTTASPLKRAIRFSSPLQRAWRL